MHLSGYGPDVASPPQYVEAVRTVPPGHQATSGDVVDEPIDMALKDHYCVVASTESGSTVAVLRKSTVFFFQTLQIDSWWQRMPSPRNCRQFGNAFSQVIIRHPVVVLHRGLNVLMPGQFLDRGQGNSSPD